MSYYDQPGNYPAPTANSDDPGKTLGIVALILSLINLIGFPTALFGLIMGHIALKQSKEAGYNNTFAKVAVISGWIIVGLSILIFGVIVLITVASYSAIDAQSIGTGGYRDFDGLSTGPLPTD